MRELKFAVVCCNNQNRSMQVHEHLGQKGFRVRSFGSGLRVSLPSPNKGQVLCYEFDYTTYREMYEELRALDERFFESLGVLQMLERNSQIKLRPERFQSACDDAFDVIFTCEPSVYGEVIRHLREKYDSHVAHVINLTVVDTPEQAYNSAYLFGEMAGRLAQCFDLHSDIYDIMNDIEKREGRLILHDYLG